MSDEIEPAVLETIYRFLEGVGYDFRDDSFPEIRGMVIAAKNFHAMTGEWPPVNKFKFAYPALAWYSVYHFEVLRVKSLDILHAAEQNATLGRLLETNPKVIAWLEDNDLINKITQCYPNGLTVSDMVYFADEITQTLWLLYTKGIEFGNGPIPPKNMYYEAMKGPIDENRIPDR